MSPTTPSVLLVAALLTPAPQARYAKVRVGTNGVVEVVTEDGRLIAQPNDVDQVGSSLALIAPDGRSVAWLALYPEPRKLVMLYNGRVRFVKGGFGEVIIWWMFQDGGRRLA